MRRDYLFISMGIIIALTVYLVLVGTYNACVTAIYAGGNLLVTTIVPENFRIHKEYAFLDLGVVVKNVGDMPVEIEGYSYELYLIMSGFFDRYKLSEGETYPSSGIVIQPQSSRNLHLTSWINLREASSALIELLKNPEKMKDVTFRLTITLKVPVKVFGIKIFTYEYTETKDFKLT